MTHSGKITALASLGWALLTTLVTGSRVTSFAGISPEFTLAIGAGMLTTSLACLGIGATSTNRVNSFRKPVFILFALSGLFGCSLLWLAPQTPTIIGCLLVGIAIACGYLLWGDVLTHLDRKQIITVALVSSIIWGITGSLLTLLDEYSLRMSLLIVVVAVSIGCYLVCRHSLKSIPTHHGNLSTLPEASSNSFSHIAREVLSLIWQPMLLVSVLGFSSGLLRVLNASDGVDPLILSALRCLCTLIIVALFLALSNHTLGFEQSPISLCLLIAAASSLLLLPIVELRFRVFIALIIDVAYLLSGIFLTVACSLTGRNVRGASMLAMGLGQGVSIFFITAGFALSSTISALGLSNDQGPWILALTAIYAIVIVLLLLNMPHFQQYGKKLAQPSRENNSTPDTQREAAGNKPDELTNEDLSDSEKLDRSREISRKNTVHLVLSIPEDVLRTNPTLTTVYRITNREMDVLILTLSGRNAAAIAQMLFVSEETVRTHLKHIYKKLNIHSKEELHRLVETVLEDGE